MIRGTNIDYAYGDRTVLTDIDFTAVEGGVVGLIGPNGSGKTTLLRNLYGALRPAAGAVWIGDTSIDELAPRDVARELAVVVQEGTGELPLTVADMVMLGRTPHLSSFQRPSRDDRRIAARCLIRVGARSLADRPFAALSGGERQRVLIARALAQQATHLMLDEPTNHLDIRYQHEILQLVASLDVTTTVVLHDLNLAAAYCDRVVLLDEGRVMAEGTPDEVLVPELLEPVYGIGVQRIVTDGRVQLMFRPLGSEPIPELEPIDHEEVSA